MGCWIAFDSNVSHTENAATATTTTATTILLHEMPSTSTDSSVTRFIRGISPRSERKKPKAMEGWRWRGEEEGEKMVNKFYFAPKNPL